MHKRELGICMSLYYCKPQITSNKKPLYFIYMVFGLPISLFGVVIPAHFLLLPYFGYNALYPHLLRLSEDSYRIMVRLFLILTNNPTTIVLCLSIIVLQYCSLVLHISMVQIVLSLLLFRLLKIFGGNNK